MGCLSSLLSSDMLMGCNHTVKQSNNFKYTPIGSPEGTHQKDQKQVPAVFPHFFVTFDSCFKNGGRDPFNQNSVRSDREKYPTTSKGGPAFSKLFRLDRTDPLSFGPKISGKFGRMEPARVLTLSKAAVFSLDRVGAQSYLV